ncbi:MAG: hypothetical protein ACOCQX_03065 [Candidatus Nanoarchaeia archaeon]
MAIVGFSFTKINVEKNKPVQGSVSVKNNIHIDDVKEENMNLGTQKQKILKINFTYTSQYNPDIGSINLQGELFYSSETKVINKVLKEWKDKNKIPDEVMTPVINSILNRSNILALSLTKEVSLPPQLKLPKVQVQNK